MNLYSILGGTFSTSAVTMLSRVFGLVRDIVLARAFGVGLDSFLVAFRIPNLLRRIFAEGAFSQALVPVLSEYQERNDRNGMRALIAQLACWLGGGLLLFSILCIFLAPLFVTVFAPGFIGEERFTETTFMLQLTFFYLPCMSMASLAAALFHIHNRFALPAFAPVLLNLFLIGAALWLAPQMQVPLYALALAVPLAGLAQLGMLLPWLARRKLLAWPTWNADPQGAKRVFAIMLPAVFAVSVTQCNLLIDTWLASFLQGGSITWLYYADRMLELPLGVFGVALATVILPYLSRSTTQGDAAGKQQLLDFGLRWACLVSLPAMLGLMLLADEVMLCLFTYENFTSHDARQAALALCAYIPGLPAMVLVKVLATEYFSRKDTATPARIAAIAVGCNLVLNLALIKPLGHVGLALATAAASWCNAWLLYRKLRLDGHYIPQPRWGLFFARLAAALATMAACVYMLQPDTQVWLHLGAVARGAGLVGIVLAGMVVFMVTAWLCGLRQEKLQ